MFLWINVFQYWLSAFTTIIYCEGRSHLTPELCKSSVLKCRERGTGLWTLVTLTLQTKYTTVFFWRYLQILWLLTFFFTQPLKFFSINYQFFSCKKCANLFWCLVVELDNLFWFWRAAPWLVDFLQICFDVKSHN